MQELKIGDEIFTLDRGFKRHYIIKDINSKSYILDDGCGRSYSVNKKTLTRQCDGMTKQYYTEETYIKHLEKEEHISFIRDELYGYKLRNLSLVKLRDIVNIIKREE